MCLEAKSVKMMILAAAFCVWFVSLPSSGEAAYEPLFSMKDALQAAAKRGQSERK